MITYKGKEYTWDEYQKKLNEDSEKLVKYAENARKKSEEFEQELKAIKNKYKKKDEYWKILPDGTPNPYGQGFYDYVVSNDVKFSKVPSIREQQMYNTEWNRRTGEPLKPWHEMPTWEKLMRLVGNMM